MAPMFSREDGDIAFVSSSRAAGIAVHVQKSSLALPNVGGSGGCVWALGRLERRRALESRLDTINPFSQRWVTRDPV